MSFIGFEGLTFDEKYFFLKKKYGTQALSMCDFLVETRP